MAESPDDYRRTSFFAILAYVLGFILVLGLLALLGAWILRLLAR